MSGTNLSISSGSTLDLSGLADNLGNHTATQNIQLSSNWLSNDGANAGIYLNDSGYVAVNHSAPEAALHIIQNDMEIVGYNHPASVALPINGGSGSTGGSGATYSVSPSNVLSVSFGDENQGTVQYNKQKNLTANQKVCVTKSSGLFNVNIAVRIKKSTDTVWVAISSEYLVSETAQYLSLIHI